jgi:hypothetical protein
LSAIAHICGAPVEELLPLACGGAAILVAARAWISIRGGDVRELFRPCR